MQIEAKRLNLKLKPEKHFAHCDQENGKVRTRLIENRRFIAGPVRDFPLPCRLTVNRGSRAIPHLGHAPERSASDLGSIGQV